MISQIAMSLATVPFYALDSSNYMYFDWSSVDWYTMTKVNHVYNSHLISNNMQNLANSIGWLVSQPENMSILMAYYSDPAVQDAVMNLSNAEFPAFRQQALYHAVQLVDSVKNDAGLMQVAQSIETVYANIVTQVHGHGDVHGPGYFLY